MPEVILVLARFNLCCHQLSIIMVPMKGLDFMVYDVEVYVAYRIWLIYELLVSALEIWVRKTDLIFLCFYFFKSVQIKLSDETIEVFMTEIRGHNLISESFDIVDINFGSRAFKPNNGPIFILLCSKGSYPENATKLLYESSYLLIL